MNFLVSHSMTVMGVQLNVENRDWGLANIGAECHTREGVTIRRSTFAWLFSPLMCGSMGWWFEECRGVL